MVLKTWTMQQFMAGGMLDFSTTLSMIHRVQSFDVVYCTMNTAQAVSMMQPCKIHMKYIVYRGKMEEMMQSRSV